MFFSSQDRYGGTALTEEEQHQVKEEFDFEGNNAMFDKVVQSTMGISMNLRVAVEI